MIYTFKSKADGDLVMLAPHGNQLLRIIGKEPAPRGIVEAADLPAAMAALERAIAVNEKAGGDAGAADDDGDDAVRVNLRQRVWPMLEMMKRSHAEHADIVWGV